MRFFLSRSHDLLSRSHDLLSRSHDIINLVPTTQLANPNHQIKNIKYIKHTLFMDSTGVFL